MSPAPATSNAKQLLFPYRVIREHVADAPRISTDGSDHFLGEFCGGIALTNERPPTLSVCIASIFQCGAKEQVDGIAAGRVIALMQYTEPIWYRTTHQRPREAMCKPVALIDTNASVAISVDEAVPRPAVVKPENKNASPEAGRRVHEAIVALLIGAA